MGLFGGNKKQEKKLEPSNKMILGVNPELVNQVKSKVKGLKDEKSVLQKSYNELVMRMSQVEGKCDAIESTFKQFKDDLMTDFIEEARKALKKEMKRQDDSISGNHSRVIKLEDELLKLEKSIQESSYMSSFQQYYQLIRFCIYLLTNTQPGNYPMMSLILQTIHSLADDMRRNGYWETGREAIITSILNLKSYWRSRDERAESLIGAEVDALENMR